jgi:hypothetical protein
MERAVVLNAEQTAMLERLKVADGKFAEHPALRSNADAIETARKLIEEAHAIKMPQVAYTGLQITVSMYDTEMDLPDHLRGFS